MTKNNRRAVGEAEMCKMLRETSLVANYRPAQIEIEKRSAISKKRRCCALAYIIDSKRVRRTIIDFV